jgi:DNA-binding NtrC family response regulator
LVATHRDLETAQKEGRFRTDLYYRLQIHRIHIPPLRERLEDIPLLVDHVLTESAKVYEKKKVTPPDELIALLQTYSFPGNVRELEAMIFTAVGQNRSGKLSLHSFKHLMQHQLLPLPPASDDSRIESSHLISEQGALPTLKQATSFLVQEALRRAHGNQTLAAQLLGITPSALNKRLSRSKSE